MASVRSYDPRLPLYSLHVPKCAGTSFKHVLETWFGDRLALHYTDERQNTPPAHHKLGPGMCVHGHFNRRRGTGIADYYPTATQFITILRDPFDTALSNFFYIKTLGSDSFRSGRPHPVAADTWDVSRYFAERPRSRLLDYFPFEVTPESWRTLIEEHFVYVGIAEDLQGSVDALAQPLGFPSVPVPVVNRSAHSEEVSEELRRTFAAANPLAYELYGFAKATYRTGE